MRAMLPRRLLPWLFVLSLLFGQAAAFAHALGHLRADASTPPDQTCEVCIAQANLGSAVPATGFKLPVAAGAHLEPAPAAAPPVAARAACAQARAPPSPV